MTSPRYLYADHQGSIVATADANGSLIATNSYDDYGISKNSANGSLRPYGRFGFTGQAWLPDLGMYHYKARIYSPTLGRFLQTDPIGYDDQINLYAYVANDPVNGRDPTGLEDERTWASRAGQFLWGAAEATLGTAAIIAGAAGDGASGAATVASGGTALPLTAPAAIASTAVITGGVALGADGLKNMAGAILNNSSSGGNSGSGGGRNAQKSNPDRVAAARNELGNLKAQRQDILSSNRIRIPEVKDQVARLDRQISRQELRIRESENHSMKGKGF